MKYILKTNNGSNNVPLYWNEKKKQCVTSAADVTVYNTRDEANSQKKNFDDAIHGKFGENDPIATKTSNKMIVLPIPDNNDIDIVSNRNELDKLFSTFGFSYRGAGNGEWYRQTKHGEITFGIADSKTIYPYVHIRKGQDRSVTFTTIEDLKKYLISKFNAIRSKSEVSADDDIRLIKRTISNYARSHKLESTELKTIINNILDDIVNEFNSTDRDDEFDWNYYK